MAIVSLMTTIGTSSKIIMRDTGMTGISEMKTDVSGKAQV